MKKQHVLVERFTSVFLRLRNDGIVLLILLLLSVPLTIQTFQPGFFVQDDGEWMIIRSSAFHEAFRDGQIPVRFLGRLNNEYGYPVPTFLYPGYLYLTEPLILLGFGFIDAIKIMFMLTMVLSGVFAYFWLSKLFTKWSALIGALVYLYTPYHLIDMYRRGSLGEMLALAMVPFILWNIERRSLFFSSLGIAGLILSHNIMAALFLPILLLYALLRSPERGHKKLRWPGLPALYGLGLSAFFWIPALTELSNTVFSQTKISEWQNYFATYATIGGLPLVLLLTTLFILLLYFWQQKFGGKKKDKEALVKKEDVPLLIFFTGLGLLAIFFSSSFSSALWHILPVTFLQFPFRFLSLEIVSAAFAAAFLLSIIRTKFASVFISLIVVAALAVNALPYLKDIHYYDKGEGFYTTNQGTTNTRDEYIPVWVKERSYTKPERKAEIVSGKGKIISIVSNNKSIVIKSETKKAGIVQVNTIYWPGWKATVNGKEIVIDYQNAKGLMTVKIPEGTNEIKFAFEETPLRLFADAISVLTFVILIAYLLFRKLSLPRERKSS